MRCLFVCLILWYSFVVNYGYLSTLESESIVEVYNALNPSKISCDWNMSTLINNDTNHKLPHYFGNEYCFILISYINEETSNLQTVTLLSFNQSKANGVISTYIGNLQNISEIYLQALPQLHGNIPPSICNLKLTHIIISNVGLDGNVSVCMSNNILIQYHLSILPNMYIYEEHLLRLCESSEQTLTELLISDIHYNGRFLDCFGNFNRLVKLGIAFNNISGNIPPTLNNITTLESFNLCNLPNLEGHIPEGIFKCNTLKNVTIVNIPNLSINLDNLTTLCNHANSEVLLEITFWGINYESDTIPQCLSNFTNLESLRLGNLPLIHQTFPEFIYKYSGLRVLNLNEINFTGLISIEQLCDLPLISLSINIANIVITTDGIPSCIQNWNEMTLFYIQGRMFSGRIPPQICTLNALETLGIISTNMNGNFPDNCFHKFGNLRHIYIQNNPNIMGTVPALASNKVEIIQIQRNKLNGPIFRAFDNILLQNLKVLMLDNNKFVDYDKFSRFVETLFTEASDLTVFTLYNNAFIYGTFPTFDSHGSVYMNKLQMFAMQGLNIKGEIPNNLYCLNDFTSGVPGTNITLLMYDNQLSGTIPPNLYNQNQLQKRGYNFTDIVLQGNLFYIPNRHDHDNTWLQNRYQFLDVTSLYLTKYQMITYNIGMIFISIIFLSVLHKTYHGSRYAHKHDNESFFLRKLYSVRNTILDWKIILFMIVLLIFYPWNNQYFISKVKVPILQRVCLFNYQSFNKLSNIILWILMIIYNLLMLQKINELIFLEKRFTNHEKGMFRRHKSARLLLQRDLHTYSSVNDPGPIIYNFDKKNSNKSKCIKCVAFLKSIVYTILFGCMILVEFIHLVSLNLPGNNTYNIKVLYLDMISYLTPVILAVAVGFLVPALVSNFYEFCGFVGDKMKCIMMLRLSITIIIPFGISFLLFGSCINYWPKFWVPCTQSNNTFNYNNQYSIDIISNNNIIPNYDLNVELLLQDEICSQHKVNEINPDKCLRLFLYHWSTTLTYKYMCSIGTIMILFIYKQIKKCFLSFILRKERIEFIEVDVEYCMITTIFESIVIFGFISPFIIILRTFMMVILPIYYKYLLKNDWKSTNIKNHIFLFFSIYYNIWIS